MLLVLVVLLLASSSHGRTPLIYLYPEDPEIFNHEGQPSTCPGANGQLYAADVCLYEILKASPYLTKDPEKADYFYLPVYLFWHKHKIAQDPQKIVSHLRKQGPWFDRRNGSDHVFIWTWDFGRCEFGQWGILKNVIVVHHYGRVINGNIPGPKGNPCNLTQNWGGNCDPTMDMFAMKATDESVNGDWSKVPERPHGLQYSWYEPCHFINHDIVVPPSIWEGTRDTPFFNPEVKKLERTGLLFFAGGNDNRKAGNPWNDAYYSGGARQMVGHLFAGKNHSRIANGHLSHDQYIRELNTHKFCLAPAGWGWGARVKVSTTHGCIPVIIQDFIRVEWEEQLPMIKYAIRVPLWLTHRLESILEHFVKTGEYIKLRKALECTWRIHRWSQPEGRAFEMLMCELRKRLVGGKIVLDTDACTIKCGGGAQEKAINITDKNWFV